MKNLNLPSGIKKISVGITRDKPVLEFQFKGFVFSMYNSSPGWLLISSHSIESLHWRQDSVRIGNEKSYINNRIKKK